ncbi:MAG: hypothetical protein IPF98_22440 [Gemmatimonadetes bacterium]|nr:hypothetical protein [Gemmatimonadota bacterium]
MVGATTASSPAWPQWQRIAFRFCAIYFTLQIAPWNWVARVPGLQGITAPYNRLLDWSVHAANARVFHVRETLVLPNGSGDTSWAWSQLWLFLSIAALGAAVWSVLDRRRPNYARAGYWLRTVVRYYIATFALSYGIIKIFALQMTFPSLSQLATPLGDLLPMRLSWLFIGYSVPYQVFSGVMETAAGLLLLPRRTVTLGLFAATGAFLNVVMINLSYDVPVKLFASHLLLACLFLLAQDAPRLLPFLALNRGAGPTTLYEPPFDGPRQRYARVASKAAIIILILVLPAYASWQRFRAAATQVAAIPLGVGVYDVRLFVVNGDTVPPLPADTLRWRDVIIDNATAGSVGTTDALFWQRYRRGHFRYKADTASKTLAVWRTSFLLDSTHAFSARYELPDRETARLWTTIRGDSVYVELARTDRKFQLAERQFHWLSEWNR